MNSEKLLIMCPLDSAHMIQKHKMQTHLVKCVRNHDMSKKSTCPYNPIHIVDTIVYEDHLSICEDAKSLLQFQYVSDATPLKGVMTVEELIARQSKLLKFSDEENWDNFVGTGPAYDPTKNMENKNIFISVAVKSKSERKAHRESERLRHAKLENVNAATRNIVPGYTPDKNKKPIIRKPQVLPKIVEAKPVESQPIIKSGAIKKKPVERESTSEDWEVVKPRQKAAKSDSKILPEIKKIVEKVIIETEEKEDDEVNKITENLGGMKIKPSSSNDQTKEKNVKKAEEKVGFRIGRRCAANFGIPFSSPNLGQKTSLHGIGRGQRIANEVSKLSGSKENSSGN